MIIGPPPKFHGTRDILLPRGALLLQALKAPKVITPGPRVRRYMTTGRSPAA